MGVAKSIWKWGQGSKSLGNPGLDWNVWKVALTINVECTSWNIKLAQINRGPSRPELLILMPWLDCVGVGTLQIPNSNPRALSVMCSSHMQWVTWQKHLILYDTMRLWLHRQYACKTTLQWNIICILQTTWIRTWCQRSRLNMWNYVNYHQMVKKIGFFSVS